MWKYIYEMGVLAQQEVVSSIGFLGKYVINFAGLSSDWLGYGQLIWAGILSPRVSWCSSTEAVRSGLLFSGSGG